MGLRRVMFGWKGKKWREVNLIYLSEGESPIVVYYLLKYNIDSKKI
jgi:hypothetical protein